MPHQLTIANANLDSTAILAAFEDSDPYDLSASRATHGDNAASMTWGNCMRLALDFAADSAVIDAIKSYFADFGAWDDDELAGWDDQTTIACMIQDIAARYNEFAASDWYAANITDQSPREAIALGLADAYELETPGLYNFSYCDDTYTFHIDS